MFHVGQKVVLVGWRQEVVPDWQALGAQYPDVGEVYTVRAVKPWKDSAVLLLGEIDNSHLGYSLEPGFRQEFFRPIVERKTDISIFTKLLKTKPIKIENRIDAAMHDHGFDPPPRS